MLVSASFDYFGLGRSAKDKPISFLELATYIGSSIGDLSDGVITRYEYKA